MELQFIQWLSGQIPKYPGVPVGAGDDAAIIDLLGESRFLITVDMLMDGVDFQLGQVDPRRIGRKALAVNLSDIAAMAGEPSAAVVSVALPRSGGLELAKEMTLGMLALAAQFGVPLVGGDTNCWDQPLVISVTVVGKIGPGGPLLRSGARPGDWIMVTGELGGSILGKHFDFEPRIREALTLAARYSLSAGMDLSDGLSLDLWRLSQASGCGARIDLPKIPISAAARLLSANKHDGVTPLEHALSDGEDFELLFTAAPDVARRILAEQPLPVPVYHVGEMISQPGMWETNHAGELRPHHPKGFVHG